MAKKNDLLGGFLDALGDGGSDILSELLEQVTGSKETASIGEELLEGLAENGGDILGGLGDVVADLTGIGAENSDASAVAKLSGKTKSSAAAKKTVRSSGKKTTGKKTTEKETTGKKTTTAKKKAASEKKKEPDPKKTAAGKASSSAKPRSSAARKKKI